SSAGRSRASSAAPGPRARRGTRSSREGDRGPTRSSPAAARARPDAPVATRAPPGRAPRTAPRRAPPARGAEEGGGAGSWSRRRAAVDLRKQAQHVREAEDEAAGLSVDAQPGVERKVDRNRPEPLVAARVAQEIRL